MLLPSIQRHGCRFVDIRTEFGNLAVKVNNIVCPSTLVEIVNVLCDNFRVRESLLQTRNGIVRRVGLCRQRFPTAGIVEIHAELRVTQPSIMGANIFDAVLFPESVGITESTQAALRRDTGTSKNNDILHREMNFSVQNYNKICIYPNILLLLRQI